MDVAAAVIAYLDDATSVSWYHNVPESAPTSFGTLTRSGGATSDYIRDQPTLTLQCYANTRGAAADLAAEVKLALMEMPFEVAQVFACDIMSDYYDPVDGYHRHRITCQLIVND